MHSAWSYAFVLNIAEAKHPRKEAESKVIVIENEEAALQKGAESLKKMFDLS